MNSAHILLICLAFLIGMPLGYLAKYCLYEQPSWDYWGVVPAVVLNAAAWIIFIINFIEIIRPLL